MTTGRAVGGSQYVVRTLEACLFLALTCSFAAALDNNRTIAQFVHTAWGPKDGAPSVIDALAQSADGYLWLAGADGLYRFDGVVFERYHFQSGSPLSARRANSLLALPNGDLWIGFRGGGISLLRNGNATNYTTHDGVPEGGVWGLVQDREGTIWAATASGLARFEGNLWKRVGRDWDFPGKSANTVFLDRQGTLWVSTEDTLVFLPRGARRFQQTGIRVGLVFQIAQAENGKLWMPETTRFVRPIPLADKRQPPDETEIQVGSIAILFDNAGALWITTIGDGLRRAPAPELLRGRVKEFSTAVESFTAKDGLSDDVVRAILQDREGNIWVGTNNGLDRFRKTNLVEVVLPFKTLYAAIAAGDAGDVRVESPTSAVRVHGGRADRDRRLPSQASYAYRDHAGAIWWLCYDAIYRDNDGNVTKIALPSWFPKPYRDNGVAATEDASGALWLAAIREGLSYRTAAGWRRLEGAPEFAKLAPRAAFTDWMGRAWFGYEGGTVVILNDKKIQRVFPANDSAVGSIRAIDGRGRHIWVGGELGLSYFDGNRFRRIIPVDAEAFGSVLGVEETPDGSLWLAESRGVIQVPASEVRLVLDNSAYRVRYRLFDAFDGLQGTFAGTANNQREIQGTDGKLWFLTSAGVLRIDPANIATNTLPPPILIRSVSAVGRQTSSLANLTLPPRTTNLHIEYTALSLAVPEKVRFRYMLEGVEKEWQDAGTRREASYNRLGPGKYHFRVIACNNDGVWNEEGARLDFAIAPAWFQTTWFQVLCIGLFLLLLWKLYQLRLKQLGRQFNATLQARVDERTRIARDLHDTLLQSLHGLMFQFQAARNMLPRRPDEGMKSLDEAISDTKKALAESRDAIQGLRSEPTATGNLPELLTAVSQELGHGGNGDREPPKFDLIEEGKRRTLSLTAQDEVCRIAVELLRNAYQHAQAHRIEAEVRYGDDTLRLRIRDNGKGIDPTVLKQGGSAGHWGLRGIRERAERIGAKVDFWSEADAGTEVQVTIPASIAYETPQDSLVSRLFRKRRNRAR